MDGTPLLSLPSGMLIDQIQISETGLAITVIATHPASCCPLCSEASSSLHSHYQRTLSDVPCGGRQVQLYLTVRRFYCHNALCERKVFDSADAPVCGTDAARNPARIQEYAVNTAIWLFVRDPKKLNKIEHEDLIAFCQASAPLKKAYDLLQDFLSMVHKREGQRLDAWLAKAAESGLAELQSFAAGVEKDKDAVQAGLTWPINNGMVEGHVTKLKLIKRQMYGKAGFALLRQRVLHAV